MVKKWLQTRQLAGLLAFGLLFSGCVAPQTRVLLNEQGAMGLQRTAVVADVPFFPQRKYQCGPAALAMVMNHAGRHITPDQLLTKVFVPGRKGSFQVEMIAAARSLGMFPYVLQPKLEHLLRELHAGHPVLVLQNLGLSWYPIFHYAVVIGYDLDKGELVLHSGTIRAHVMSFSRFEYTWRRAGSWALVVLAPGDMPATAEKVRFLGVASDLEEAGRYDAAIRSYKAAVRAWPESMAAWIGLGNSHFATGNLSGAQEVLSQAASRFPDAPVVYNNLAQVYLKQKLYPLALKAARKAVRLSPGNALFRQTLSEIELARKASRNH